jgi:YqaJ-like recombinase protein
MLGIEVDVRPDTPEFDTFRLNGIGGSEICAAAGDRLPPEFRSRYGTAYEVAARKLRLLPEWKGNAATRRGKRAEKFVIDTLLEEYEPLNGVGIARYPVPTLRHPKWDFLYCTPDCLLDNDEGIEAKTSTTFAARDLWGEEETDDIPPDALCQAQLECEFLDVEIVHVPLMLDIWKLKPYRVVRNQQVIDTLIEAARDLWQMIRAGELPEPIWTHPSTLDVVRAINRDIAPGQIKTLSEEGKQAERRRLGIAIEKKALDAEDDSLKAQLLHEIGDAAAGDLCDGYVIRRQEVHRKSYVVEATSYIEMRRIKLDTFLKG